MDVADEILKAAEKLLAAQDRLKQASADCDAAAADYRRIVAMATVVRGTANGNGTAHPLPTTSLVISAGKLRDRIVQYMMQRPGVPIELAELERGVNAEAYHRRLVWTLANMRRDGVIKHEGRGLWSIEPPEEPKDDADISF